MNQRIRSLAEQAGYEKDEFGVGHWDMPECKKFAQLIAFDTIKDCRDQFVVNSVSWNLLNDKLKHFGVEE